MKCVTANDMAGNDLNDQKSFRKALRGAALSWHTKNEPWTARNESQRQDMKRICEEWKREKPYSTRNSPPPRKTDRELLQGFDPIVGKDARVVILGTLPGGESLRLGQYYADSGNAFWYIVQQLFGIAKGLSYDERVKGLIKNRIAIWDVLQRAARSGSQDGNIAEGSEVANDFGAFFGAFPSIKDVFFNGGLPRKYFHRLVVPVLPMGARARRLSPALQCSSGVNTHHTPKEKAELWRGCLIPRE
jgi:TDG/mug DNA glycosylase family protein